MTEPALVVDRNGLAKKLANRPKAFIFFELIQNAWDEDVTTVRVQADMLHSRPVCRVFVEDDSPKGFDNLESVYTLFRDSKKAGDPEKRGRFELGEKLVAALALRMEVYTTKGTVVIDGDTRTILKSKKKDFGTTVLVDVKLTREEFAEAVTQVRRMIPPKGVRTIFNEKELRARTPLHTFETTLQTVRSDFEGNLTTTQRKTTVEVHEVLPGETAHIYEMGIPVVETNDQWHYNIQQRVPVNWERTSVPPSYLKTLRVEVLNAMHDQLSEGDAVSPWVTDASDDARCGVEAIKTVVTKRFGDKAVIYDASDLEGTKMAVSQGYTVVHGGSFSKGTWDNIREAKALLPAGQVTPSPKVYDPDGDPERIIPPHTWTSDMVNRAEFARRLFLKLLDKTCVVEIVNEPNAPWVANFGHTQSEGARLCLNHGRLKDEWFELENRDVKVLALLIHEYGHYFSMDHLSAAYHSALTVLGAKITNIALNEPEFFGV